MNIINLLICVGLVVTSNLIVKVRATKHADDQMVTFVQELFVDPWMWGALAAVATGMFIYILTIRRVDVSYAQPFLAIVFVVTPFAAWLFLGETISALRAVGLAVMGIGVALVAISA
jgi:drug/metabolite transporter (DMT)-like permease